jgi:hypothetical protein
MASNFDGYGLTGSVSEEIIRILWGNGKNGPYRETERILLGDYSDTCGVCKGAIGTRVAKVARRRLWLGLPKSASDKEILDADGEGANALACRVVDGVGHRGVCADIAEFADPLDASRIHLVVHLRHENDL